MPLKEMSDGYWADAKEVCDELQMGPSRIDGKSFGVVALFGLIGFVRVGPAKVYTMRGKYKQYFLRVTSEGGNDCTPANLKVTRDRTMDVFVEHVSCNSRTSWSSFTETLRRHPPTQRGSR